MVLRRIAYTCLALFRAATRAEDRREEPWKRLLERIRDALRLMTDAAINTLRLRHPRACVCG